jgi:uncharacterized protein
MATDQDKLRITSELFKIPVENRTILYAPLAGSVVEVTPGVENFFFKIQQGANPYEIDPVLAEHLFKTRILVPEGQNKSSSCSSCHETHYSPTSVTLLPTFGCNLNCEYCYACAGDLSQVIKPEIAKASIDFIVENALKKKSDNVNVGFHGGGEPLLSSNLPLINYALAYLKETSSAAGLKSRADVVTNGVHSLETMQWAVENFDRINISIDGPEDIQNRQRPKKGGQGSFNDVVRTIKYLDQAKAKDGKSYNYGMRATITDYSVKRIPEILEFFSSISRNKSFHLEPLFECGRCQTTGAKAPDPGVFLEQMLIAEKRAKDLGVSFYYSGGSIDKISETFCGACGGNFFITPTGFVTTCLEACREESPIFNSFKIGQYNETTGKIDFNLENIENLRNRKVTNMEFCEDCFAKYNCAGDCPAKVLEQSGKILDSTNNARCVINRGLLKSQILQRLNASEEIDNAKTKR